MPSFANTMAFDLTCLQTAQANSRSSSSAAVGARFVTTLQLVARHHAEVAALHQQAAVHAADLEARVARREPAGDEQAHVLLLGADLARLGARPPARRSPRRTAARRSCAPVAPSSGAVEGDDAAERRGRVGAEGAVVGLAQVGRHGDAAGVGVLDDHAGRRVELPHALERGVGVGEVVERQLLALQLRRRADRRALRCRWRRRTRPAGAGSRRSAGRAACGTAARAGRGSRSHVAGAWRGSR